VVANLHKLSGGPVQGTQVLGPFRQGFATRLLPADGARLQAYRGGRDGRLLTVAEVAQELAVCTATVYKLVARGELGAVRVLNAIRVRREDLNTYTAKGRSGF